MNVEHMVQYWDCVKEIAVSQFEKARLKQFRVTSALFIFDESFEMPDYEELGCGD